MMVKMMMRIGGAVGLIFTLGFIFLNYGMAASAGMWTFGITDQLRLSLLVATLISGLVFAGVALIGSVTQPRQWLQRSFNLLAWLTALLFLGTLVTQIGIWAGILGALSTGLLYFGVAKY